MTRVRIGKVHGVGADQPGQPEQPVYVDDRRLLNTLADGRGRTTAELAETLGRSTRATHSRLAKLVARGLLVEIESSPNDPHHRYYHRE